MIDCFSKIKLNHVTKELIVIDTLSIDWWHSAQDTGHLQQDKIIITSSATQCYKDEGYKARPEALVDDNKRDELGDCMKQLFNLSNSVCHL